MKNYLGQLSAIWTAKGNKGKRLQALLRAVGWYVRSRFKSDPMCHEIYGDRRIWCHPGGFIARSIMLFGEWCEYDSLHFIHAFLRPEDNFLDVGSNIGLFSILASKTVAPSSICCVEPGKIQRDRLEENLKLNELTGVHVYPFAVGNAEGIVNFSTDDAVSHVIESETGAKDIETVRIKRMDSFLPGQIFHLSKIDVEGFELPALRGAASLIESGFLPILLLELNGSSDRFGIQACEILEHLGSSGYRVGVYKHDEKLISCSDTLWDDVLAFNAKGEELIRERIEGIRIV